MVRADATAMAAVIMATIWKSLSVLHPDAARGDAGDSPRLYEAAGSIGPDASERFRYVTWPGIRAAETLGVVLNALWAFQEIDIIYLTTGGGPAGPPRRWPCAVYQDAFADFRMGPAAALGMLTMALAVFLVARGRCGRCAGNISDARRTSGRCLTLAPLATAAVVLLPIYWMLLTALLPASSPARGRRCCCRSGRR